MVQLRLVWHTVALIYMETASLLDFYLSDCAGIREDVDR